MKTLSARTVKTGTGTASWANVPLFGTDAAGTADNKKFAVGEIYLVNTSAGGANLQFRYGTAGDAITVPANSIGTAQAVDTVPAGFKQPLSLAMNNHIQVIGNTVTYRVSAHLID